MLKLQFRALKRYKVIDYGLADFEARYAAGMIGDAAAHGTQSAPKEETHRQRKQRERESEKDPGSTARRTLALRKNVIPSVSQQASMQAVSKTRDCQGFVPFIHLTIFMLVNRLVLLCLVHEWVLLIAGFHTGAHLAICLEAQGRCVPPAV